MKKLTKLLTLLLALTIILGMFAGCQSGGGSTTPSDKTPGGTDDSSTPITPDGPKYGGHLNARSTAKPNGLDPLKQTGLWKYQWTTCVFENALTRDADNKIAPSVCNYTLSDDQLTLTLWVREGANFSNGDPVDIYDVEASINRALNLYSSINSYVKPYLSSMTVNGDKLTLTFKSYNERIMYYLAAYQPWCAIMPKEICEKYASRTIVDEVNDAIGTGPYKFAEIKLDESVTIIKRDGYVPVPEVRTGMASPKMGYLDSMTFTYVPQDESAIIALMSGDYDLVEIVPAEYHDMVESLGIVYDVLPSITGTLMKFNNKGGNNVCSKYPSLRKAIMAAIDYEEFLKIVTDNQQIMGGCPVVDETFYTDAFIKADYYGPANLELSQQYLQAAKAEGYKDEPVQLVLNNAKKDIATLLCKYLDDAGILYKLTMMESGAQAEFIGQVTNNWDFYFVWQNYSFTPATLAKEIMENTYSSPRKDELYKKLGTLDNNSEEYMSTWNELAQVMADDCVIAYMSMINWYWYHPTGFHSNDTGMVRYFFNSYWDNPQDHTK